VNFIEQCKPVALLLARHVILLMIIFSGAIIITFAQIASRHLLLLFIVGAAHVVAAALYFRVVRDWSRWLALAYGLAVVWFLGQLALRVWL
jgi:hypothetical protein